MTIGLLYEDYCKERDLEFIKRFEGKWMYGNDTFYYHIIKDFLVFKSDSCSIIDRVQLTIKDILSFEEITDELFLSQLNTVLVKAYLNGVYLERKYPVGWYKFATKRVNIMEEK